MDLNRACNILNITVPISLSDIKKKYYRAALSCHPDRNSDSNSTAAFQELSDAYNFLCMHLEVEKEEVIEEECSYISIIERFIKVMIGQNYDEQKEWLMQNTAYFAGDAGDEFRATEEVDDLS